MATLTPPEFADVIVTFHATGVVRRAKMLRLTDGTLIVSYLTERGGWSSPGRANPAYMDDPKRATVEPLVATDAATLARVVRLCARAEGVGSATVPVEGLLAILTGVAA